jgi:hypothetical protein
MSSLVAKNEKLTKKRQKNSRHNAALHNARRGYLDVLYCCAIRFCLPAHEPVDFGAQFVEVVDVQVDTGEPDVGDLIGVGQVIQYQIADDVAVDFAATQAEQCVFDLLDNGFDGVAADRSFYRCDLDAGEQFLPVVGFPATIAFDHQQVGSYVLIGGEPLPTVFTLAPAADVVARLTRIDYFMLCISTVWTTHITPK